MAAKQEIVVKGPVYFSAGDENAFFAWLSSISCVEDVGGHAYDLHIRLKRRPGDQDLREFVALFHRYKMGMTCLAKFKTDRNAAWFAAPGKFWHTKVFAKTARKTV